MRSNTAETELAHLVTKLIAAFRSSKTTSHISHAVLAYSRKPTSIQTIHQASQPPDHRGPIKLPGIARAPANPKASTPLIPVSRAKAASPAPSTGLGTPSAILAQAKRALPSPAGSLFGSLGTVVDAVTQRGNTSSTSSPGSSGLFSHLLQAGLGLMPLVSGIVGLFKGHPEPPPPLIHYLLPKSVHFEVGLLPSQQTMAAGYTQNGRPRAVTPTGQEPQGTAIAQLFDTSLLHRSDEIAQAVKEALLYSHSLNDVIADL